MVACWHVWRHPRVAKRSAANRLLLRHAEDGPPPTPPASCRSGADSQRGATSATSDELLDEVATSGAPSAPHLGRQDNKAMRPWAEELRIATPFAGLSLRDRSAIPVVGAVGRLSASGERAYEGSIAAQCMPHGRGAVDHQIQAAAIIVVHAWCRCGHMSHC